MRCIILIEQLTFQNSGNGHQDEEAVIYVAYFKIICAMGVERRDKGSVLFHISKYLMSRDARKPVFGVSDQVRHKPACISSETS